MRSLLPGPTTPEFIWRLQGIFTPLELLDSWHQQYGDTFRLPYAEADVICVASPSGLQSVFTAPPEILQSNQKGSVFELVLGEQAMVFLEGAQHQRHRRLLAPPFHGESLLYWGSEVCRIAQQVIRQLQPGSSFVVRPLMKTIALQVILRVVFGLSQGSRFDRLYGLLNELFQGLNSPLSAAVLVFPFLRVDLGPLSPWGQFIRQRQEINQLITAEICERQKLGRVGVQNDLLALLLQTRDETGQSLSETEIRDELLMLVFAGYETTTSAIVWALYWMCALPQIRNRIEGELREAPDATDPIAISQLPYLNAVCQEVLRIYPVAIGAFARRVKEPFEIDGYRLSVDTIISPSIYLAHRRLSVYPNPLRFQPERFLERTFSPYEYLPFGGGNRRCLGGAFAMFEIKMILITFIKQVQLALVDSAPINPIRYGITMAPPTNLQMRVIKASS